MRALNGAKRWIVLGIAALAIDCTSPPKQGSARSDLSRRMMDYYKAPDFAVVEALLESLDEPPLSTDRCTFSSAIACSKGARPPVVGFLASIFHANPGRVQEILDRKCGESAQYILALSLHYSGEATRASDYLRRHGWPQQTIDDLGRHPTALDDVVINRADDLDLLWGAFFATGDLEKVAKIIAFAVSPRELGIPVRDVLGITIQYIDSKRGDPSGEKAQRMKERFSGLRSEEALRVTLASAAMWAVGTNAEQHPLLAEDLKRRIARSPDSEDATFWRWAVFQSDHPKRIVMLDVEPAFASMMTVRSREDAVALVRNFSLENLEAGGVRELERGTPPIVLLFLRNKLRCDGEYRLTLTEPGGTSREYPPAPLRSTDAQAPLQSNITTLAPDGFQVVGSYEYSLRITACGKPVAPISNGFFVY